MLIASISRLRRGIHECWLGQLAYSTTYRFPAMLSKEIMVHNDGHYVLSKFIHEFRGRSVERENTYAYTRSITVLKRIIIKKHIVLVTNAIVK